MVPLINYSIIDPIFNKLKLYTKFKHDFIVGDKIYVSGGVYNNYETFTSIIDDYVNSGSSSSLNLNAYTVLAVSSDNLSFVIDYTFSLGQPFTTPYGVANNVTALKHNNINYSFNSAYKFRQYKEIKVFKKGILNSFILNSKINNTVIGNNTNVSEPDIPTVFITDTNKYTKIKNSELTNIQGLKIDSKFCLYNGSSIYGYDSVIAKSTHTPTGIVVTQSQDQRFTIDLETINSYKDTLKNINIYDTHSMSTIEDSDIYGGGPSDNNFISIIGTNDIRNQPWYTAGIRITDSTALTQIRYTHLKNVHINNYTSNENILSTNATFNSGELISITGNTMRIKIRTDQAINNINLNIGPSFTDKSFIQNGIRYIADTDLILHEEEITNYGNSTRYTNWVYSDSLPNGMGTKTITNIDFEVNETLPDSFILITFNNLPSNNINDYIIHSNIRIYNLSHMITNIKDTKSVLYGTAINSIFENTEIFSGRLLSCEIEIPRILGSDIVTITNPIFRNFDISNTIPTIINNAHISGDFEIYGSHTGTNSLIIPNVNIYNSFINGQTKNGVTLINSYISLTVGKNAFINNSVLTNSSKFIYSNGDKLVIDNPSLTRKIDGSSLPVYSLITPTIISNVDPFIIPNTNNEFNLTNFKERTATSPVHFNSVPTKNLLNIKGKSYTVSLTQDNVLSNSSLYNSSIRSNGSGIVFLDLPILGEDLNYVGTNREYPNCFVFRSRTGDESIGLHRLIYKLKNDSNYDIFKTPYVDKQASIGTSPLPDSLIFNYGNNPPAIIPAISDLENYKVNKLFVANGNIKLPAVDIKVHSYNLIFRDTPPVQPHFLLTPGNLPSRSNVLTSVELNNSVYNTSITSFNTFVPTIVSPGNTSFTVNFNKTVFNTSAVNLSTFRVPNNLFEVEKIFIQESDSIDTNILKSYNIRQVPTSYYGFNNSGPLFTAYPTAMTLINENTGLTFELDVIADVTYSVYIDVWVTPYAESRVTTPWGSTYNPLETAQHVGSTTYKCRVAITFIGGTTDYLIDENSDIISTDLSENIVIT